MYRHALGGFRSVPDGRGSARRAPTAGSIACKSAIAKARPLSDDGSTAHPGPPVPQRPHEKAAVGLGGPSGARAMSPGAIPTTETQRHGCAFFGDTPPTNGPHREDAIISIRPAAQERTHADAAPRSTRQPREDPWIVPLAEPRRLPRLSASPAGTHHVWTGPWPVRIRGFHTQLKTAHRRPQNSTASREFAQAPNNKHKTFLNRPFRTIRN